MSFQLLSEHDISLKTIFCWTTGHSWCEIFFFPADIIPLSITDTITPWLFYVHARADTAILKRGKQRGVPTYYISPFICNDRPKKGGGSNPRTPPPLSPTSANDMYGFVYVSSLSFKRFSENLKLHESPALDPIHLILF